MSGPFKMKGHSLPGPHQASPAKHGDTPEPHTKKEEGKKVSEDYNKSMEEIYKKGGHYDKDDMLTANIVNTAAQKEVDDYRKKTGQKRFRRT